MMRTKRGYPARAIGSFCTGLAGSGEDTTGAGPKDSAVTDAEEPMGLEKSSVPLGEKSCRAPAPAVMRVLAPPSTRFTKYAVEMADGRPPG